MIDAGSMMHAFDDDIVLVGELREEMNGKLWLWRQALEEQSFH